MNQLTVPLDSVREHDTKLEERSNSFAFDENDEERIMAEVQRRYEGGNQPNGGGRDLGVSPQGSVPMSSFGGPQ